MRWALLSVDGKSVENLVEATQAFVNSQQPRQFVPLPPGSSVVEPGYTFSGGKFSPPPPDVAAMKGPLFDAIAAKGVAVKALNDGSLQAALVAATTPEEITAVQDEIAALR